MFKPILRRGLETDMRFAITDAVSVALQKNMPFQSCLNCHYFEEKKALCNKFNQTPPPRVIVFSCPEHKDTADELDVPF